MRNRKEEERAAESARLALLIEEAEEAGAAGVIIGMGYPVPGCVAEVDVQGLAAMLLAPTAGADEGSFKLLDRYFDALLNRAMAEHKQNYHREHFPALELMKSRKDHIDELIPEVSAAVSARRPGRKGAADYALEGYLDVLKRCSRELGEILDGEKVDIFRQNDIGLFEATAGEIISRVQGMKELARLIVFERLPSGMEAEAVVEEKYAAARSGEELAWQAHDTLFSNFELGVKPVDANSHRIKADKDAGSVIPLRSVDSTAGQE